MTPQLVVMRRPRRRDHLALPIAGERAYPLCGITVSSADARTVPLPLVGGATRWVVGELRRELGSNACIPCTRLANMVLLCAASRDTGRPAW